jgi:hypothetical protein
MVAFSVRGVYLIFVLQLEAHAGAAAQMRDVVPSMSQAYKHGLSRIPLLTIQCSNVMA